MAKDVQINVHSAHGHVEEAGEGCGGVGHDVGGVVHGYIAQMEREKENRC